MDVIWQMLVLLAIVYTLGYMASRKLTGFLQEQYKQSMRHGNVVGQPPHDDGGPDSLVDVFLKPKVAVKPER